MTRLRLLSLLGMVSLLAVAALLLAAPAARAQVSADPGAGYSITWYTVDAGGGTSTGNGYTLRATAGQPDAGALSAPGYGLGGGFWGSLTAALHKLFLPLVRR